MYEGQGKGLRYGIELRFFPSTFVVLVLTVLLAEVRARRKQRRTDYSSGRLLCCVA
jgi:hypothetical protein